MDIHELKQFESVYQPSKEIAFCWLRKQYVQLSTEENHAEVVDHANDSLRIWQAAKAQAVPDGFVVVPKKATKKMLDAGYEAHDRFFSNGAVQDVYVAMIEAQEPANAI